MSDSVLGALDALIVDDDNVSRTMVESALSEAGYSIMTAGSGGEALDLAKRMSPRLLVLDVGMPDLNGYEVCRRLRADPATADVPVLFLSSSADTSARIIGLQAGGVDYLCKPFAPLELQARVEAQLQIVALREQLNMRNHELRLTLGVLQGGLAAASRVQAAMLPSPDMGDDQVRFGWRCMQYEQLGGDAVNILRLAKGIYAVYVLDASGHGVPSSLLAVAAGYFVTALAGNLLHCDNTTPIPRPSQILDAANRVIAGVATSGAFVTMLCGIVHLPQRRFTFAAGGHPGPMLLRQGQGPLNLDYPAPPVALGVAEYIDHSIELAPGDRLLLYTDGAYEQRNAAGNHLGRARLAQLLAASRDAPTERTLDELVASIHSWRGSRKMEDDVSLLVIDIAS